MPTNPNNEANRGPAKRRNQKELQKQNDQTTVDQESAVENKEGKTKKKRRKRKRVFPIWLRIVVVLVLCAVALVGGLMIGYGIIGDGNATEALEMETWRHILDLIEGQN